jgi:3-hydroxy-9,10-secoandrosta-1,3,5(10)-triene-9,17-dione monooxygenase
MEGASGARTAGRTKDEMTVSTKKAEWAPSAIASRPNTGELAIHFPDDSGWLTPNELAALTPQEILARVRALKPLIAANAAETENQRRPVQVVWNALRKTGAFYHFVPKRFGGLEFDVESFLDIMLEIGEACPSTCWTATFSIDHNWLAAHFPEEAQKEFFVNGRYISAPGTSNPLGKAVSVPGGFRLNGHYRFGSGVMNADWVFAMGMIEGQDPPSPRWFAIPAEEVVVLDTWHVDGLAGTGSNDILVRDVFVPEYRTLIWADAWNCRSPGSRINSSPMYRMPPVQFLAFCTSITPIAAVRGMIKLHRERLMNGRLRFGETVNQYEKSSAQVRLARADLLNHSAELTLRDVVRALKRLGESDPPDDLTRTRLIAQCAMATSLAHEAATLIARGAGASIHARSNPLQRLIRDVNVATSHQLHEFDEVGEQYGRALLGLEPTSPQR